MKHLIYAILSGILLFAPDFSSGFNPNDISSKNGSLKKGKIHSFQSSSEKISMREKTPRFVSSMDKRSQRKQKPFSLGALQKDHPLYKLGLRSQDVIKGVNGKKVSSEKSFLALLKRSNLGGKNTLSIERGGKRRNIYYTVKNKRSSKGLRYRLSKTQDLPRFKLSKKSIIRADEKRKKYVSRKQKAFSRVNAAKKDKWALSDKTTGKKRVSAQKASVKKKITSRGLASNNKIASLSNPPPLRKKRIDRKKVSRTRKTISRGLASEKKVVNLPKPSSEKGKAVIKKATEKKKPLSQKVTKKNTKSLLPKPSATGKAASLPLESSMKKKAPPLPSFDKLSKKEKKLLARKSKYLQRAYVLQMNSKVYDRPHFDAQSIYIVPAGGKILISRKIFTPASKFGTFYKIFIHKDRKVVGYVSEIDVVSKFERGGRTINPRYAILRTQLNRKQGPVEKKLPEKKENWPVLPKSSDPAVKKKPGNRFAGLSLLVKWDRERNIKGFLGGVKLSGQGFLSSSLNMDMNIMSDVEFRKFHVDLLGIFDLIRGRGASLYFGGGLEVNIERISQEVAPGLAGSLGLRTLLLTGIFWQNELRVSYEFDISKQTADYSYGFLTSFQFRF